MADDKLTPSMEQYVKTKEQYKNHIVFYRMGDFYEMFYEDAVLAAKVLHITLTQRGGTPMAGVPYHAKNVYLKRLINAGYSVAICEQLEDSKHAKGLVKRDVVEIITPGVQTDYENLAPDTNNYLLTLIFDKKKYFLSYFDYSTFDFFMTNTESEIDLFNEIAKINPSEILLNENLFPTEPVIEQLKKMYSVNSRSYNDDILKSVTVEFDLNYKSVVSTSLTYLFELKKLNMSILPKLRKYDIKSFMNLTETTISNLELFKTSMDKSSAGSLYSVLNKTLTAMGSRKLRYILTHPLLDVKRIEKRLEGVEFLIKNYELRNKLEEYLKQINDIERLLGKILSKTLLPKEVLALSSTLTTLNLTINEIKKYNFPDLFKELLFNYHTLDEIVNKINNTIIEEPPNTLKDGNVIKKGVNKELDELIDISKNSQEYLINLELREKNATNISSLKIKYNKIFGYFIEISKSFTKNVPSNYEIKQTLTNGTRYTTKELKELEVKILSAEETKTEIEQTIYGDLLNFIIESYIKIKQNSEIISYIDVIYSFAKISIENNYTKPVFAEGDAFIEIKEGRHPVIEQNRDLEKFIPNDLILNKQSRLAIITGPNMAGKSTIMRQTALIVLIAQIGCFVPATSYNGTIFDSVFTRVGASDNLTKGESTFMVEMREASEILTNATDKSLLIIDELGRGTSTFDGISLAWSIAEYIHDKLGSLTLFATHYHELTQLQVKKENVVNYNISIREINGKLYYLRKLVKGPANKSYGIHVAEIAGIPKTIIQRANQVLQKLEDKELNINKQVAQTKVKTLPLFENVQKDEVKEKLKEVDINNMTPLQALLLLNELKKLSEE